MVVFLSQKTYNSLYMLSSHITEFLGKVSQSAENSLLARYGEPCINVNTITSKAGSLYEKLRYIVEYKDEHHIRRSAIERILKRKVATEDKKQLGNSILEELVQVGYAENNTIPQNAAGDVQNIISKYLYLSDTLPQERKNIWSLAATEIERFLWMDINREASLDALYKTIGGQVFPHRQLHISSEDLAMQSYIGSRRALLNETNEEIVYALFVQTFPEWVGPHTSAELVEEVAQKFGSYMGTIENEVNSSVNWRIMVRLKNHAISFDIIKSIVDIHGPMEAKEIFEDPERFREEVYSLMTIRNTDIMTRIKRSGTRAIIYILVTKVLIGLLIELPFEYFILNELNYLALGTNILFHPLLLLFMVKTIKYPDEKNTERIIVNSRSILSGAAVEPIYVRSNHHSALGIIFFIFFYAILIAFSFGTALSILLFLGFNSVSILLFLFFLALVSYFGLRTRHKALRWKMRDRNEKFGELAVHFLSLPVIQSGQWLAQKMASVNIFIIIFDVLLETPFKVLLKNFDAFVTYLKDTKDDLA